MTDIYDTYYAWLRIRNSYEDRHMIMGDEDTDLIDAFLERVIEVEEDLKRFSEGLAYKPSKKYKQYLKSKKDE